MLIRVSSPVLQQRPKLVKKVKTVRDCLDNLPIEAWLVARLWHRQATRWLLEVASQPGRGSTFLVYFPCTDKAPAPSDALPLAPKTENGCLECSKQIPACCEAPG